MFLERQRKENSCVNNFSLRISNHQQTALIGGLIWKNTSMRNDYQYTIRTMIYLDLYWTARRRRALDPSPDLRRHLGCALRRLKEAEISETKKQAPESSQAPAYFEATQNPASCRQRRPSGRAMLSPTSLRSLSVLATTSDLRVAICGIANRRIGNAIMGQQFAGARRGEHCSPGRAVTARHIQAYQQTHEAFR